MGKMSNEDRINLQNLAHFMPDFNPCGTCASNECPYKVEFTAEEPGPEDGDNEWSDIASTTIPLYSLPDGRYQVDVPGFCQDDLDVIIEGNKAIFTFQHDKEYLSFYVTLPDMAEDLNIQVEKGQCSFGVTAKNSDVSVFIGPKPTPPGDE